MHLHRIATFLLGLWLAVLGAVSYVATHNFQQVDRLLVQPGTALARLLAPLSYADARLLLRHQAAELNRQYFSAFELAEIAIGVLLAGVLLSLASLHVGWRGTGLLLLALTLFNHFALTQDITMIGRTLDFIDPALQTPERAHFWQLHNVYSGVTLLKMAMLLALTGRLVTQRSRRVRLEESRKKADLVDDRYHSQIDR